MSIRKQRQRLAVLTRLYDWAVSRASSGCTHPGASLPDEIVEAERVLLEMGDELYPPKPAVKSKRAGAIRRERKR